MLEQGRQEYGVGIDNQICLLLDRGGTVFRNGNKKQEKLDMGVIPNLVKLLRHLYGTIAVSYSIIIIIIIIIIITIRYIF